MSGYVWVKRTDFEFAILFTQPEFDRTMIAFLVKNQVLYSKHFDSFGTFRYSINTCISVLDTRFKNEMQSLIIMDLQLF